MGKSRESKAQVEARIREELLWRDYDQTLEEVQKRVEWLRRLAKDRLLPVVLPDVPYRELVAAASIASTIGTLRLVQAAGRRQRRLPPQHGRRRQAGDE